MEKGQTGKTNQLIIIGGSSGSLEAMLIILPRLKPSFNIPLIIVMHRNNTSGTALVELLSSKTHLKVKEADEKDKLLPGWIYIAPPDYHLLVEDDETLSLDMSEKVHYCRPSIDVSFASAAVVFKENLTAVLLSGANADGVNGMDRINQYGGLNIAQDPLDAQVAYMPQQAITLSKVDHVMDTGAIIALLNSK